MNDSDKNVKNARNEYVRVSFNLNRIPVQKKVRIGTSLQSLLKTYQKQLPYQVVSAKVNNKMRSLTRSITEECEVEFLDLRSSAGIRVYQRSLIFLYIKALYDLYGHVDVAIQNPLNKGLYSEVKIGRDITEEDVSAIEKRMREIVKEDIPFIKNVYTREEAMDILEKQNLRATKRLLIASEDVKEVTLYSCGELKEYFYGHMVPSTSYLDLFDLRKYKNGILLRHPDMKDPSALPSYFDDKKLFTMFEEAAQWGKLMEISFVCELNEKIKTGEIEDVVKISEALHEKKIAEIADIIQKSGKRIVLICGPSSSGKTTFANRLMIQLRVNGNRPVYLGTDDYFVERIDTPLDEFGNYNFEDIEAIDIELFNKNINDLLTGKEVDLPTFNFFEGCKEFGKRKVSLQADQPVVIEGIHGLNNKLTAKIPNEQKFKIYISPLTQLGIDDHNRISTTDGRLIRRLVRDKQFRGYSAKKTLSTWADVRRGEEKNIFPYNGEADVMFNSALIYELSALRPYLEPMLLEIRSNEPEYPEAMRILRFLMHFSPIPDDSIIVNNSIIREFIGGSIFFS